MNYIYNLQGSDFQNREGRNTKEVYQEEMHVTDISYPTKCGESLFKIYIHRKFLGTYRGLSLKIDRVY